MAKKTGGCTSSVVVVGKTEKKSKKHAITEVKLTTKDRPPGRRPKLKRAG